MDENMNLIDEVIDALLLLKQDNSYVHQLDDQGEDQPEDQPEDQGEHYVEQHAEHRRQHLQDQPQKSNSFSSTSSTTNALKSFVIPAQINIFYATRQFAKRKRDSEKSSSSSSPPPPSNQVSDVVTSDYVTEQITSFYSEIESTCKDPDYKEEEDHKKSGKHTKLRKKRPLQYGKVCVQCRKDYTPQWRKIDGKWACNACALKHYNRKRHEDFVF